jgi:hypothetical protein
MRLIFGLVFLLGVIGGAPMTTAEAAVVPGTGAGVVSGRDGRGARAP